MLNQVWMVRSCRLVKLIFIYFCRTNEEDMHVNGEGNYGFCGPDCPVVTDSSRISDRINLVNNDAIVFEENPNPPPN